MRLEPLSVILDKNFEVEKIFYFISGNEATLIQKIKSSIIEKYKKKEKAVVTTIESVNDFFDMGGLFEEKKIFVVNNCKVKSSHVLVYREQHGYEIKYPAFLLQFTDAEINSNMKLNTKIDNISGATLSVNSMKRMAKTALLLNKLSNENSCT